VVSRVRVLISVQASFLTLTVDLRVEGTEAITRHLKSDSEHVSELLGLYLFPHQVPPLSDLSIGNVVLRGVLLTPTLVGSLQNLLLEPVNEVEVLHTQIVLVNVLSQPKRLKGRHLRVVHLIVVGRAIGTDAFHEDFIDAEDFRRVVLPSFEGEPVLRGGLLARRLQPADEPCLSHFLKFGEVTRLQTFDEVLGVREQMAVKTITVDVLFHKVLCDVFAFGD